MKHKFYAILGTSIITIALMVVNVFGCSVGWGETPIPKSMR